jgi:hypothetical protein
MNPATDTQRHYPEDRLRAYCVTWVRQGDCPNPECRKPACVGYLDGEPITRACTECGLTEPIPAADGR